MEGELIKTFKIKLPTQESLPKHVTYFPMKCSPFLPGHICFSGLISLHIQTIQGHSLIFYPLYKNLELTIYGT